MSKRRDIEVELAAQRDDLLRLGRTSGYIAEIRESILLAHAMDGANRPIDLARLARLDRQHDRAREAEKPRFERVGELRSERVARLAAERAHAAAIEAAIEADPPLGSELNPIDLTTPAAIERNDRAERVGGRRPVRDEISERARRAAAPRRGFAVVDYSGRGGRAA